MSIEGVDYSSARPGGAALAAAGKAFAVRYLAGDSRGLTGAELADLRGHGLAVAVVHEGAAQGALAGFTQGAADAVDANNRLIGLGLAGLPVYFAVDFAATAAQQGAIDAYLRGAASILGLPRVGVYGSYPVISRCRASGTATWFWQTYAWSAGQVDPRAHLYQYSNGQTINGGAVDFTRALQTEYGQHPTTTPTTNPVTTTPVTVPQAPTAPTFTAPQPAHQEDDMAFTAKDPTGQVWHLSGVFRRPISQHQADELSVLAPPATVPFLGAISPDALAGYADISGLAHPVVTPAP